MTQSSRFGVRPWPASGRHLHDGAGWLAVGRGNADHERRRALLGESVGGQQEQRDNGRRASAPRRHEGAIVILVVPLRLRRILRGMSRIRGGISACLLVVMTAGTALAQAPDPLASPAEAVGGESDGTAPATPPDTSNARGDNRDSLPGPSPSRSCSRICGPISSDTLDRHPGGARHRWRAERDCREER